MKVLEFETSKGKFVLVDYEKQKHEWILNTNWFCDLKNITEEQAIEIVDEFKRGYKNYSYKAHKLGGQQVSMVIRDYFNKSTDSLYSLFHSKGIHLYDNPYINHTNKDLEWLNNEITFYNPHIFKL